MPNQRRKFRPRRPRAVARRRFSRVPRTVAAAPGGFFYRTQIPQDPVSETSIGTVAIAEIVLTDVNTPLLKQFTQIKFHRIGVRIYGLTYLEFIVRGIIPSNLNTRKELVSQGDLRSIWVNNGRARTIWFKPNQSVQKFWIDLSTSSNTLTSGLHIAWTGQNQLNSTGSGLVFQTVFDVTFQGPLSGTIA